MKRVQIKLSLFKP